MTIQYTLQVVVKMMVAGNLLNLSIISILLNNCSTWIGIKNKQVDRLEAIQDTYIRLMLEVPVSTPKVALWGKQVFYQ